MHKDNSNALVLDGTPHIPNPKWLKWHTTFTFIRDVLCDDGNDEQAYTKAKERYPDLNKPVSYLSHFKTFGNVLNDAKIERRKLNIHNVCRYGIRVLDQYLGGILPSELVVIWADTWVGKSEIAYTMATHNANRGKKVLLFALEWDVNEVALRFMQKWIAETGTHIKTVEYRFNLDKKIYQVEDDVIAATNENIKNNLMVFNKEEVPSLKFIKDIIEQAQDDIDMIIIDHLHYIHLSREDELREIGEIMRTLKTVSDIVKKPIILISHIRKKDNKNKERDPEVADLYGSSNIGKEATTVLLISRISAASAGVVWVELPEHELDKRYFGTKIIVAKSRVWFPRSAFGLIYDLQSKKYMDKFQGLMENESWAKEDDKIVIDLDTIEV